MFEFTSSDISNHSGAAIVLIQDRKPAVCVARGNDDLQLIAEGLDRRRRVNADYLHLAFNL